MIQNPWQSGVARVPKKVPKEDDLKKLAILGWCIEWLQAEHVPGYKRATCSNTFWGALVWHILMHYISWNPERGGRFQCVALRRMWQAVDTSDTSLQIGSADIPQSQKIKMG